MMITQSRKGSKDAKKIRCSGHLLCVFATFAALRELPIVASTTLGLDLVNAIY
jgi:hypothetical protein